MPTETETADPLVETGPPKYAHYVAKLPGDRRHIDTVVLQAVRNGTVLVALCGYRWVPSKAHPKTEDICPECLKHVNIELT